MSNDSALDRTRSIKLADAELTELFDRSEPLIPPWLTRGPGSGAIFRCIDCSFADPNPPAAGSCHARLFKLSGYRPPCELSESFFWRARAALDVLNAAKADPGERAKAARLWAELYRVVHAELDETSTERGKRIARLNDLAALAGLLNAAKAAPMNVRGLCAFGLSFTASFGGNETRLATRGLSA
jgi:hypothetical protein